jgi:hypothetical protein
VTAGALLSFDKTERDLRAIIGSVGRPNRPRGSLFSRSRTSASVVNEARLEQLGTTPIEPVLRRIDAIRSAREVAAEPATCPGSPPADHSAEPWGATAQCRRASAQ